MTAAILDIGPAEYHKLDRFSSSVAKTVIARSPLHAKHELAEERDEATKEMDFGAVTHRLVLGKGADFEVLDFDAYRSNAAKDARDAARAAGKVPILEAAFARANVAAEAIRVGLAERGLELDGDSEVVITWDEAYGVFVPCRAMLDHAWLDRGVILDLKITADAAPTSIERTAENLGYAIQAAAYTRAVTALRPELAGRVDFMFAFCEADKPFAMNVCRPDGVFRELGERRWLRAVKTWAGCLATGRWPGYGDAINVINPPTWALAREGFTTEER